ncbi:MAG TPA: phosphatidylinositol-specific phospholipase C/glycerophosphodiester phosphodiesterase family protein [Verrucomicrobiae bacterium]|nr:phosphatidylinositol-specific phospholipase C/glycerophosphodiester phosphodiesterase family protein [Verrucomicrobiae bacterium]
METVRRLEPVVAPLPQAHAHNDYEHTRPLLDALDLGFCSVEADVWLVDGQLLVAHDREKTSPQRTLRALYLDVLRERVERNGGRVYANGPTCTLMIDVKSEAAETYLVLRTMLRSYAGFLTTFTPTNVTQRALTVIISGNRAIGLVAAEPLRYVALDGRLTDLKTNAPADLFPFISDNWQKHFTWRGEGSISSAEQDRLRQLVQQAHQQGQRIRFWAAPDFRSGWQVLKEHGVDLIGSDDLAGLAAFLRDSQH